MMKHHHSVIAAIIVGTILEWYDFALLGCLAPIFSTLFFSSEFANVSLLATFGVFASGFISRPIGGVVLGHIGDRYGCWKALSISIVLMALSTTLIGLLPTFKTIGISAPILLISLRLIQGFAASGEYPGAICIMMEIAPLSKRGFLGSVSMLGTVGGVLLGSLISALMSTFMSMEQIYSWGWRIPFLLGIPLGFIGWFLRYKTQKIINHSSRIGNDKFPFKELIKFNLMDFLKITLLFSLSTISFYTGFVYIVSHLINIHKITFQQGLINTSISTICLTLLIPVVGYLSDRINRKILMLIGVSGLLIFYYPIFILFSFSTVTSLLMGQFCLAILIALFIGPLAAIAAESFPQQTRYSGVSLSINVGATIFGGTCPVVAAYIVKKTGNSVIPALYPMLFALICLFIIMNLKQQTFCK